MPWPQSGGIVGNLVNESPFESPMAYNCNISFISWAHEKWHKMNEVGFFMHYVNLWNEQTCELRVKPLYWSFAFLPYKKSFLYVKRSFLHRVEICHSISEIDFDKIRLWKIAIFSFLETLKFDKFDHWKIAKITKIHDNAFSIFLKQFQFIKI